MKNSKKADFLLGNPKEKELNKIKSKFISIASHEFRTPLTVIKEANMLLLDGIGGKLTDKQKYILNIAKRNIDRLVNLFNEMLSLSKKKPPDR
jgi:two-component system sensor histidine kinase GlrK